MENKLLSEKVKEMRSGMAWSQSHLAEAAGLSTRTIQRLEQTGQCSYETLLSVAATLDIQIHELTELYTAVCPAESLSGHDQDHLLWKQPDQKRAFIIAGILFLPSFLFVLLNLFKYEWDMPRAYDLFLSIGETRGIALVSGILVHPVFLVLSAFTALVLCVLAQVNIRISRMGNGFSITGLHVTFSLPCSLILLGCLAGLGIMFGYAVAENLGQYAAQVPPGIG